jgi:hypothetical protein
VADAKNQVIISAKAIGSGAESGCFPDMLDDLNKTMQTLSGEEKPLKDSLECGDTGYFSEANLQAAAEREIEALIPDPQFRKRDVRFEGSEAHKGKVKTKAYFTIEDFSCNTDEDNFTCPAGKVLPYRGEVNFKKRGTSGKRYGSTKTICGECPLASKCIKKKNPESKKSFRTLFCIVHNMGKCINALTS